MPKTALRKFPTHIRFFFPEEGAPSGTGSGEAAGQSAGQSAGDGEEGKGGKAAVLADLAKERDARQALEKQIADREAADAEWKANLAKALGVGPEETSATDKLAEQIKALQTQVATSTREATILKVAAAPGVDAEGKPLPAIPAEYHHLLTASETEALQEQARSVAALIAANAEKADPPNFQTSNGQGHSGSPGKQLTQDDLKGMSPEAIVEAKSKGLLNHLMGVK